MAGQERLRRELYGCVEVCEEFLQFAYPRYSYDSSLSISKEPCVADDFVERHISTKMSIFKREITIEQEPECNTYAEKSADPVAAIVASAESLACQTAPLWPRKVPILFHIAQTCILVMIVSSVSI